MNLAKMKEAIAAIDKCGAEAVGILQSLDGHGHIPEAVRGMVVELLQRWRVAVDAGKAAQADV